jgi:hypothetical protein
VTFADSGTDAVEAAIGLTALGDNETKQHHEDGDLFLFLRQQFPVTLQLIVVSILHHIAPSRM